MPRPEALAGWAATRRAASEISELFRHPDGEREKFAALIVSENGKAYADAPRGRLRS